MWIYVQPYILAGISKNSQRLNHELVKLVLQREEEVVSELHIVKQ